MPRELADVLHYILPELEEERSRGGQEVAARDSAEPLPILTVPLGAGELVRATLLWNLALETATSGERTVLLAPGAPHGGGFWPRPGAWGGAEVLLPHVANEVELGLSAVATAKGLGSTPPRRGAVLVATPPEWLTRAEPQSPLLRWLLVFVSPVRRTLRQTASLLAGVSARNPDVRISLVTHGTRSEAERAWIQRSLGEVAAIRDCGRLAKDPPLSRAIAGMQPLRDVLRSGAQAGSALASAPGAEAAESLREIASSLFAGSNEPMETIFGTR